MLRASLTFSTLVFFSAFAQSPETAGRLVAQQKLLNELRVKLSADMTRYTPMHPEHPQIGRSRELISVLEEQSKLLQTPREQWKYDAVRKQTAAITFQVERLRSDMSRYSPSSPTMPRNRAILDLLELELQNLTN